MREEERQASRLGAEDGLVWCARGLRRWALLAGAHGLGLSVGCAVSLASLGLYNRPVVGYWAKKYPMGLIMFKQNGLRPWA